MNGPFKVYQFHIMKAGFYLLRLDISHFMINDQAMEEESFNFLAENQDQTKKDRIDATEVSSIVCYPF